MGHAKHGVEGRGCWKAYVSDIVFSERVRLDRTWYGCGRHGGKSVEFILCFDVEESLNIRMTCQHVKRLFGCIDRVGSRDHLVECSFTIESVFGSWSTWRFFCPSNMFFR